MSGEKVTDLGAETSLSKKHGALRPQKPLRLIRDGEVGGSGFKKKNLTPTCYSVTIRMALR